MDAQVLKLTGQNGTYGFGSDFVIERILLLDDREPQAVGVLHGVEEPI
jgi:hypothetical protein